LSNNKIKCSETIFKFPRAKHGIVVLIDPPSYHYHKNLFFDLETSLNRDNTLQSNFDLKETLESAGYPVFTADMYDSIFERYEGCNFHYWGFGASSERALRFNGRAIRKIGVVLFEPPIVKPDDYKKITQLASSFEHVFLHNTIGDGYQLPIRDLSSKLIKFYWTNKNLYQTREFDSNKQKLTKIALIAGAHFSKAKPQNGYGKRLAAIRQLGLKGDLDLYGFGWRRIQIRSPFISVFWLLKLWLAGLKVEKPVRKFDVYRRYDFSLCLENMAMSGFITEKIFDSIFAGCIPIYWGAPDIEDYIPSDCFIALDDFEDIEACFKYCCSLSKKEKKSYRLAMDRFLKSKKFEKFAIGVHGYLSDFYKADKQKA